MRAWRVTELAGPEAIRLEDVAEPDAGDLVVDVRAAGVSFPDLLMTRGEYQYRQPLPFTLGWEGAGVVRHAPADSPHNPGDRVITMSFGSYAEQVAAQPAFTFPLPAALDFAEGAAFGLNYLTALAALKRRGNLQPGETVLVQGAAGGTGTAAIQVAKGLGARTIAAVSSEQKAGVARAAGADETVLVQEGWRERVTELSGGGVDVLFDPVGGERFDEGLRALAPEGRYLVVGFAGGAIPTVKVNRLLLRNVDVRGVSFASSPARPAASPARWTSSRRSWRAARSARRSASATRSGTRPPR